MVTVPVSADTVTCARCDGAIELDQKNHLKLTGALPPAGGGEVAETPELLEYFFHASCTGGKITGRVERKGADRCAACGGRLTQTPLAPLTLLTAVDQPRGGDSSPLAAIESYPLNYHRDCFNEIRADWSPPE